MLRRTRFFRINKVMSGEEAVKDIFSGAQLAVGGFGLCGTPHYIIQCLQKQGARNLTAYSNNAGVDDWGLGILLQSKQIKRMCASYVGENKNFERMYLGGELEVEFNPQGTLAERMRAGGAGIPAFFTRTGFGTKIQEGGFPIKFNKDGTPAIVSEPKEARKFGDHWYIMESGIKADFAIIKAWKADKAGNLVFRGTTRNFNVPAAQCGAVCIAEVEELVEIGELKPDEIHVPSVYVHRIVHAPKYEKRIEFRTTTVPKAATGGDAKASGSADAKKDPKTLSVREKLARRAALEFSDGMYVNLGIGIPTLSANYLPADMHITLQSENGLLGMGSFPPEEEVDADLINAGKQTVSYLPHSATFSSDQSFAMIRGGHMDLTILGALQVAENGDLANWIIPGKMVKGMGGAMDLVASGCRVIVTMEHVAKDKSGKVSHKILKECTLPLTGKQVVNRLITDLCVIDFENGGMVLKELAPGVSVEDVKAVTKGSFTVADNVTEMKFAGINA